jgi:thioredoxin 1
MSDSDTDEIERIREQKKQELMEQGGPGGSETEPAPDEPIEIKGADHLDEVVSDYQAVLVDCYADWCGPCQMMEPAVADIAASTDAAVAKLDVDANQQLAGQLGAQSIPTLILYADGEPAERLVGAQDKGTLQSLVTQYTG